MFIYSILVKLISLVLLLLVNFGFVKADTKCRADVSYKTVKKIDDKETKETIFWGTFSQTEKSTEAAKIELNQIIKKEQLKALQECKRIYQYTPLCIAGQLGLHTNRLQTMSFSARKLLEKQVSDMCAAREIECYIGDSDAIQCIEEKAQVAADGADGATGQVIEGDDKKSEDKKK